MPATYRRAVSDEPVEVVDADGEVLDVVTRAEMRARNLRHRAVAVFVRRSDGDLLVHQRAPWKDVWPSYWDLAFGGVCAVGETWIDAARRELREEAGIAGPLEPAGRGAYEDDAVSAVAEAFTITHDGPCTFPDGEVVASAWIPLAELPAWVATHDVCPDSQELARTIGLL
jgi:isopentenyldiphosphate isomerase